MTAHTEQSMVIRENLSCINISEEYWCVKGELSLQPQEVPVHSEKVKAHGAVS